MDADPNMIMRELVAVFRECRPFFEAGESHYISWISPNITAAHVFKYLPSFFTRYRSIGVIIQCHPHEDERRDSPPRNLAELSIKSMAHTIGRSPMHADIFKVLNSIFLWAINPQAPYYIMDHCSSFNERLRTSRVFLHLGYSISVEDFKVSPIRSDAVIPAHEIDDILFNLFSSDAIKRQEAFAASRSRSLDYLGHDCLNMVASFLDVRDVIILTRLSKTIYSMIRDPSDRSPEDAFEVLASRAKCRHLCIDYCTHPKPARVYVDEAPVKTHPLFYAPFMEYGEPFGKYYLARDIPWREAQLAHTMTDNNKVNGREKQRIKKVRDKNWKTICEMLNIPATAKVTREKGIYKEAVNGYYLGMDRLKETFANTPDDRRLKVFGF